MNQFLFPYKKSSSHRIRAEEKKVYHKLIKTLILFMLAIFFSIYIGLPLFIKIIIAFSSLKQEKSTVTESENTILLAPTLDLPIEATNSSLINISGFANKDTTVQLIINNEEKAKVLSDKEGKFSARNISLNEGLNTITAYAIKNNTKSPLSNSVTIIYKKNPPFLEIDIPDNGKIITGDSNEIVINGETDPENEITVNDRIVIIDQQGKFSYQANLNQGENKFIITAKDRAGNLVSLERKVIYNP